MTRIFDLLFALLALLVLSPLLVPVCFLLRVTGEGEVFYLQDRVGRNANKFKILKFATMLKDSPNIGPGTVTVKNDPRVLPFGSWLRKTKINELPQLINILIGDMSVIGPRPVTCREFSLYNESSKAAISSVRPGLSGIGSVVFRNEEALMSLGKDPREVYKEYIAPYKGALEEWFAENISLSNYFTLIFLTVWVVLFPRSQLAWKIFVDLPIPPNEIKCGLNYPI